MDKLEEKRRQLLQALDTLDTSIRIYKNMQDKEIKSCIFESLDDMQRIVRDSMIQRFEYCCELFWKYIKRYLDGVQIPPEFNAPAPVIRTAFSAGILNEVEGEHALDIVKDRNRTPHIYQEEIAEILAAKIPQHSKLMFTVTQRLVPQKN